jgi:hypothetical protein
MAPSKKEKAKLAEKKAAAKALSSAKAKAKAPQPPAIKKHLPPGHYLQTNPYAPINVVNPAFPPGHHLRFPYAATTSTAPTNAAAAHHPKKIHAAAGEHAKTTPIVNGPPRAAIGFINAQRFQYFYQNANVKTNPSQSANKTSRSPTGKSAEKLPMSSATAFVPKENAACSQVAQGGTTVATGKTVKQSNKYTIVTRSADANKKRKLDESNESSAETDEHGEDQDTTEPSPNNNESEKATNATIEPAKNTPKNSIKGDSQANKSPPWYPPQHPNAKFPTLNNLNINIMDRTNILGQIRTENVLREILAFQKSIDEAAVCEATNSKTKRSLVSIPMARDKASFYKQAKTHKWIESIFKQSLCDKKKEEEVNFNDAIYCMVEYLMRRHKKGLLGALEDLKVLPVSGISGAKEGEDKVVQDECEMEGGLRTDEEKDQKSAAVRRKYEKKKSK